MWSQAAGSDTPERERRYTFLHVHPQTEHRRGENKNSFNNSPNKSNFRPKPWENSVFSVIHGLIYQAFTLTEEPPKAHTVGSTELSKPSQTGNVNICEVVADSGPKETESCSPLKTVKPKPTAPPLHLNRQQVAMKCDDAFLWREKMRVLVPHQKRQSHTSLHEKLQAEQQRLGKPELILIAWTFYAERVRFSRHLLDF